jgi:hypothetical protein
MTVNLRLGFKRTLHSESLSGRRALRLHGGKEKGPGCKTGAWVTNPGGDLRSHAVTSAPQEPWKSSSVKPASFKIRRNKPLGKSPRWTGTTKVDRLACLRIKWEPVWRLAITVPEEELEQVARSRHLVQRQSDRLGVDCASWGNRPAVFPAALDVKPHRFQNAALRCFDGLSEAVDARKVVAVSVVMLSFSLDCNRITVNSHLVDVNAEEVAPQL